MPKNNKLLLIRRTQVLTASLITVLLGACAINQSSLIEPSASAKDKATNPAAVVISEPAYAAKTIQSSLIQDPFNPTISTIEPAAAPTQTPLTQTAPVLTDIWQRFPHQYGIPHKDNARIQTEIRNFTRHPDYLSRVSKRAAPYLYHIVDEIERRGMPMELALLPIVESAYKPFAYSPSQAAGIWQFIPSTARHYGLTINWWYDGRRDVFAATDAALTYLQYLHNEFESWPLALAAYNAGEGNVRKAIRRNRAQGKPTDYWSLSLPRETRQYVPRLLAVADIVARRDHYGIKLTTIPNEPYLVQIDIGSQIDLALVEELTDLPIETIYRLNPGFNQWATDPDGPHKIALPIDKAEQFSLALSQQPATKRVKWQRHKIRSGETLSHIADQYNTKVAVLQKVNKLLGHNIRADHQLMIPVAVKSLDSYVLSVDQRMARNQHAGSGNKVIYSVRRGDSLWKIAKRFNVSVSKLTRWNNLTKRAILKPGRKLAVWPHSKNQHVAKAEMLHYTVRRGDSLHRISRQFKVSISDLVNWNTLDKKQYLKPGQKLKVASNTI